MELNTVMCGDCRELATTLPDASVDLIFTDPPYPHEFLPLYSWLSETAARVLKPGRLCVAYSGKTALPEVMFRLAEHLQYHWMFSIYEPGTGASLWKYHYWSNHRPIFVYSNGGPDMDYYSHWLHDARQGSGRDKRFHRWGQGQGEAEYYIYSLTKPGEIVYDPFMGGGTTAAACKSTGRQFYGSEMEAENVETCIERLRNTKVPLMPPVGATQPNLF